MTEHTPHSEPDFLLVRETLVHDVRAAQPDFDPRQHTSLALEAFRRIEEQLEAKERERIDWESTARVESDHAEELREQFEARGRWLEKADEQMRLIAEAAGADGTSPDDWRALTHKWDAALNAVVELRKDYDEAIGVSSPASRQDGR